MEIRFDARIATASPAASDHYADQRDDRQRPKKNRPRAGAHQVSRSIDGFVASPSHTRRKSVRQDVHVRGIPR
jgi:hypothetical protein